MATTTSPTPLPVLPYAVGHAGPGFLALVAGLVPLTVLGLVAYAYQFVEGEAVTGLRDLGTMGGATWGLYIVFVVYFVGVSFAGITVAAMIRLFDLTHLRPVARMAELLTVVALVMAALAVIIDLGQPGRGIINLFRYARPQSPFFGTFTLVLSGYLIASYIYFYLDSRRDAAELARRPTRLAGLFRFWAAGYQESVESRERHDRATFWLSLAIIPLLVIAHSTLGFVFGIQGGAAGWYSALQAPAFVVLAGVSGIGHIIVMAAIARRFLHLEAELPIRIFSWFGNMLWVLIVVALYFVVAEMLTGGYAGHHHESRVHDALLTGEYAWLFWSTVGLLIISLLLVFGQFATRRYSIGLLVTAGVLVNLAAIGKRYLIVVPSQTHGSLLPYDVGSYAPTWVEYAIVVGLMALGALAIVVTFKLFPIMDVRIADEGA
ncbi:MAG: NrfD/PsrC family molybdoenzyme membrane anchor subunit [Dehalococcoidia bacterium]